MRSLQNAAAFFFIVAVVILTFVSIFGIWNFFSGDVIWKSFETLGLLAVIALIIITAGDAMNKRNGIIVAPNPIFQGLRSVSFAIFVVSSSLFALFGVLAIWNVIADQQTIYRVLGSVAVLAFSSGVVKVTCDVMDKESASVPPVSH